MKPGLTRAMPMGIIGFILGAIFTYVLRDAQGLDPVWDPNIGFIMSGFVSSAAFIYGMGAFDPRMNAHPHEPKTDETGLIIEDAAIEDATIEDATIEDATHHEEHHEDASPTAILGHSIWQASFWTILVVGSLILFAALPTPFTLHHTNDPDAAADRIGSAGTIDFLGNTVEVTQLSALVIVVVVIFATLTVVAGGIGFIMFFLNTEIQTARAAENIPLEKDAGEQLPDAITLALYAGLFIALFAVSYIWVFGEQFPQEGWLQLWLAASLAGVVAVGVSMNVAVFKPTIRLAVFVAMAAVLYGVFYAVLIGLVVPKPESVRVALSAGNALIVPFIFVYPVTALRGLGNGAGSVAKILRGGSTK